LITQIDIKRIKQFRLSTGNIQHSNHYSFSIAITFYK